MQVIHNKLKRILEHKAEQTAALESVLGLSALQGLVSSRTAKGASLKSALKGERLSLIAEFKKASPSAGVINSDMAAGQVAKLYTECGASAMSVLTENRYFMGSIEDLAEAKRNTNIPVLRKDFLTCEYDLYYSAAYGADAVLLIAAVLDCSLMRDMYQTAYGLGLECLVEVHNLEELERVVRIGADIIGVNNRNLTTFEVDINNFGSIAAQIPDGCVKVAESGISTAKDIELVRNAGADAVLIGSAFGRSEDVTAKLKELGFGAV